MSKSFDKDNLDCPQPEYAIVPEGEQRLQITNAEIKKTKDGNSDMIALVLVHESTGAIAYDNIVYFNETKGENQWGCYKRKRLFQSSGFWPKDGAFNSQVLEQLIGRDVLAEIEHYENDYNGQVRTAPRIRDYIVKSTDVPANGEKVATPIF